MQVDGDAEALVAEQWASAWLGSAWVAMGEREPERPLCTEVVGRASARSTPHALAAVAALLRVAPESERAMLEESVQILGATQPAPSWIDAPRANPVAGWRAVDV